MTKNYLQSRTAPTKSASKLNLTNKLLVASPSMADDYFAGSIIYVVQHNEKGVMGFIINQLLDHNGQDIMDEMDITVLQDQQQKMADTPIFNGGPVNEQVGFVVHTGAPNWKSSVVVAENISFTTSMDVLESISSSDHVKHFFICIGCATWGNQQIIDELNNGDWLVTNAPADLLFETVIEDRLQQAYAQIGINPGIYIEQTGCA